MGPRKVGREQSERDFWGKRRNSQKAEPAKQKFAGESGLCEQRKRTVA